MSVLHAYRRLIVIWAALTLIGAFAARVLVEAL